MSSSPRAIPSMKLGFGASNPWGLSWFDSDEARRILFAALEGGITRFDTAGFYGRGEAERRLGAFLTEAGASDVLISTKVGTQHGPFGQTHKDFSLNAIKADLAASLKRLNRESIDLLYVHGPGHLFPQMTETVRILKDDGLVRQVGVCGVTAELALAVKDELFDAIMGVFNVFDQSNADVFKAAHERGMIVHAVAPLAQAHYVDNFWRIKNRSDLWRVTRSVLRRRDRPAVNDDAQRLLDTAENPAQAALQFVLEQPFVHTAFTTTTKLTHLKDSLMTSQQVV